eukprot:jgi/Tetstr1/424809/TSEL_015312.t1
MAVVTVQIGQCGNALGGALWEAVDAEWRAACRRQRPSAAAPPSFPSSSKVKARAGGGGSGGSGGGSSGAAAFAGEGFEHLLRRCPDGGTRARAVLVDTEPKAVQAVCRGRCRELFEPAQCVLGHSGCANNWAHGYFVQQPLRERPQSCLAEKEASLLTSALAAIRNEVQQCATLVEFLLIHSIAGGSGSGLGSRILEELRREYPGSYILTVSVAPNLGGDTPVQSLNACMTLQWLQAYADGVLLFRNDALLRRLQRRSEAARGIAASSFADINRYIARAVAGILLPDCNGGSGGRAVGKPLPLRRLVQHVCPHPEMKFLEAHHVSVTSSSANKGSTSWTDAARLLASAADRFDSHDGDRPVQASGTLAIAWGALPPESDAVLAALTKSGGCPHVAWRSDAVQVHTRAGCPPCLARDSKASGAASTTAGTGSSGAGVEAKGLTIVSNRSSLVGLFRKYAEAAAQLCSARAYVHWYERYGCPMEALQDAAQSVEQISDCYSHWYGFHLPAGAR